MRTVLALFLAVFMTSLVKAEVQSSKRLNIAMAMSSWRDSWRTIRLK